MSCLKAALALRDNRPCRDRKNVETVLSISFSRVVGSFKYATPTRMPRAPSALANRTTLVSEPPTARLFSTNRTSIASSPLDWRELTARSSLASTLAMINHWCRSEEPATYPARPTFPDIGSQYASVRTGQWHMRVPARRFDRARRDPPAIG